MADFVKAGGNLLALGLDQPEANAFLPFKVGMKKAEHIAAFFEPAGMDTLLAGVGPADVHNRAPRELPLVSSGAEVIGDGVLAKASNANVVFCQFPPYTVSRAEGACLPSSIDGDDAVDGKQMRLLTLGTATEGGLQFGQTVAKAGEVGKTYTFAVFVKSLGGRPRAAAGDRAAGQPVGPGGEGRQRSCRSRTSGPSCTSPSRSRSRSQKAGLLSQRRQRRRRLRLDLFRIYEGEYVPWRSSASGRGGRAGGRRTALHRRELRDQEGAVDVHSTASSTTCGGPTVAPAFQLARLLANMGVAAPTPLLARFSSPVTRQPETRWLDAFYLDQPEDWDYPYRFFCW